MSNLPTLADDPEQVWVLLLDAFGQDTFTPMIARKFPAQFTGDLKNQRKAYENIEKGFNEKIDALIEQSEREIMAINAEKEAYKLDCQRLERFYS